MTRWFDDTQLLPLRAFGTLPDWLAAGMDGDQVKDSLERHVPELATRRTRLLSVTPERLRAKSDEWLARYRLTVVEPDGDQSDIVVVGNLWSPTSGHTPERGFDDGRAFGQDGWRCWLADVRLELRVETHDPALPALEDISDPEATAQLLQEILQQRGYRDAVIASCRPEVVRYKPGSRCTVVVTVTYRNSNGHRRPPDPIVIKTHQGDKGQTAWAAMTALWDSPIARGSALALAEPLAYLPERRVLVQGPVPEEYTLKELARRAITDGRAGALDELRTELAKTGRALAALHRSGAVYGRTATFEEELTELDEVISRLALSVPALQQAAAPLLGRLQDLSAAFEPGPSVPAHHDFRPAQVLLHNGSVGFIDFDGASMAEPALDLGRFRAKLRDIGISVLAATGLPLSGAPLTENLALLDELCDHFLHAYLEHAPVSTDRVLLWETSDLLTAMLHAWTKVRLARLQPRLLLLQHHLESVRSVESELSTKPVAP